MLFPDDVVHYSYPTALTIWLSLIPSVASPGTFERNTAFAHPAVRVLINSTPTVPRDQYLKYRDDGSLRCAFQHIQGAVLEEESLAFVV
jgi:hypothetical protein